MEDNFTYQHILLAVDFSKSTAHIANRAYSIAQQIGANLSIVHVMSHTPMAYGGEFTMPIDVELENMLKKQAQAQLAELGNKLKIPTTLQFIKEGSVKSAVIELATEIKADLIVVGSHGHHGLALLLGSQANAILHEAPCDVWIIHIPEE